MLRSSEAFTTLVKCDNGTLIHHLCNFAVVDCSRLIKSLILVPRILLELLVTKAQTTILLVNLQHNHIDVGTDCSEL